MATIIPDKFRALTGVLLLLLLAGLPDSFGNPMQNSGGDSKLSREAAQSAAAKFQKIHDSVASGQPFGAVRLGEAEVNSYLRYEMPAELPRGVSKARMRFEPGRPEGFIEVDFDRMKEASRTPPNPLMDIFLRGVHTIGVEGTLSASGGMGQFRLDTVTLDGIALPRTAVEYLIDHYLKQHYPDVAIDRPFPLPFAIDKVTVDGGSVSLLSRPAVPGR